MIGFRHIRAISAGRLRESKKKLTNIPGKVFYLFQEFVSEKSTSISVSNREKLDCESELF